MNDQRGEERQRLQHPGKRVMRPHLAPRPFTEKIALLEKLRDRSLAMAASSVRQDVKRKSL